MSTTTAEIHIGTILRDGSGDNFIVTGPGRVMTTQALADSKDPRYQKLFKERGWSFDQPFTAMAGAPRVVWQGKGKILKDSTINRKLVAAMGQARAVMGPR
jgi:hypothetical protein